MADHEPVEVAGSIRIDGAESESVSGQVSVRWRSASETAAMCAWGKLAGDAVAPQTPIAGVWRLIDIRKQVHAVDGGGGAQSRLANDLVDYRPRLIGS